MTGVQVAGAVLVAGSLLFTLAFVAVLAAAACIDRRRLRADRDRVALLYAVQDAWSDTDQAFLHNAGVDAR